MSSRAHEAWLLALKEIDLPSELYLTEVVDWVAYGSLPDRSQFDPEHRGGGFGSHLRTTWIDRIRNHNAYLSPRETRVADLQNDPRWEAAVAGVQFGWADYLSELVAKGDAARAASQAPNYQSLIAAYAPFKERYASWQAHALHCLGRVKTKILAAVSDGTLAGKGDPSANAGRTIPPEAWSSDGVDWSESMIASPATSYSRVHFDIGDVMRAFPPTDFVTGSELMARGEVYYLATRDGAPKHAGGRPPKADDVIYAEAARMLLSGKILETKAAQTLVAAVAPSVSISVSTAYEKIAPLVAVARLHFGKSQTE